MGTHLRQGKTYKAGIYYIYFFGLGVLVYAYRTNPSELRTMDELRELRQMMSHLQESLHNKEKNARGGIIRGMSVLREPVSGAVAILRAAEYGDASEVIAATP
ncbi:unnamed protein product [Heligmosomoides polygyrus]|uniref:Uncharacterized protein n=1 Tax=Heligmosomoides polygyrus TaxID=6339 RepID=A0A3P8BVL5_HELPZ|nr:unnamed protein product [Heligmosomoides polygyrus]